MLTEEQAAALAAEPALVLDVVVHLLPGVAERDLGRGRDVGHAVPPVSAISGSGMRNQ